MRAGQAKFAYSGLILGSSKFTLLLQLPLKLKLNLKVLNVDSKIIMSLILSKSLTHSVVIPITMRKQKIIFIHAIFNTKVGNRKCKYK